MDEIMALSGSVIGSSVDQGAAPCGETGTMVAGAELFWGAVGSTPSSPCEPRTLGWFSHPNCAGAAAAKKPEPGGDDAEESVHFRGWPLPRDDEDMRGGKGGGRWQFPDCAQVFRVQLCSDPCVSVPAIDVKDLELLWGAIGSIPSSLCEPCTSKWSGEGWCPVPTCTGAAAAKKPEPGGDDAEESVRFRG